MNNKICVSCLMNLGIENFRKWSRICKKCQSIKHKAKWQKRKELLQIPDRERRVDKIENGVRLLNCKCCSRILSEDNFHNNRSNLSGKMSHCKECKHVKDRNGYHKHHSKRRLAGKEYYESNKEKINAQIKQYRSRNKEKVKRQHKHHRDKHSKRISDRRKLYYQQNKHAINQRAKEKRKTHLPSRLAANLRSRISVAVKNGNKKLGFYELIGCTTEELRVHIEKLFLPQMSWDNYGKKMNQWHIDHIVPCIAFDLTKEEEQRKCFHYSNLRPLWALDNLSKNKYDKPQKQYNPPQ